jgi:hypothetical protein
MQVYGHQFQVNYFDPCVQPLHMQRKRSQIDLQTLTTKLQEISQELSLDTGFIKQDLTTLH